MLKFENTQDLESRIHTCLHLSCGKVTRPVKLDMNMFLKENEC